MSKIQKLLKERDLLFQISNEELEIKKIYVGFDGTAESLQVGNLTPLAVLKHLTKINIQPIVILGGATSRIGDPSGKTETRKQLANDTVESNINRIKYQISKLVPEAEIVNNYDWLGNLSFMEFLDKVASYVSVSSIINLKTFAARLEKHDPLTMKEIIYPLMQGYDFLWLYENMQCDAQLGGQDQWCNLLTGLNLIQKKHSNDAKVLAITAPLLTDAAGNKMGKSVNGAIYLNTDPYEFWNFWRNIEDSLVRTCLLRFTDFAIEEIDQTISKNINEAKIKLANYITTWVHSKEEAIKAENLAKTIFINKNYTSLNETLVTSNKLSEIIAKLKNISTSEAKRLIEGQAIKINNKLIIDTSFQITEEQCILNIGKKDVFKIKIIKY